MIDQCLKSWYIITCRKASYTAERFRNQQLNNNS
ncbi:hypothetical protein EH331_10185 [Enterococcus faecalis]|nr:hypothetical protein [Enterococcus faecalis]EGO9129983.1 hypothetical protein [Enterococcus faecalis]